MPTEFGKGAGTKVLLHPPVLKALGLKHKIHLGIAAGPVFRMLGAARHLRGTRFDPFGRTEMRRTERALVDEYRTLMARSLAHLSPASAGVVMAIAASAEEIRGYEDVKRRNIERFRSHTAKFGFRLVRSRRAGPVDAGRRRQMSN